MADHVIGEIELPPAFGDWRVDLRRLARSSYAALKNHGWVVLLGIQPGLGPNTRRYAEAGWATLEQLRLEVEKRANVLAALNNYLFGFLHREAVWQRLRQRSGLNDQEWAARLQRYLDQAGVGDAGAAELIAVRFDLASEASFESASSA